MAQQACVNGGQTSIKPHRDGIMDRIRETNWRPGVAFLMILALFDGAYAACIGRGSG
jgi:hypothetical protein